MNKRIVVVGLLGLALGICRLPMAAAAEESEHKEGEAKIPATISGIWAGVKEHEEELGKTIADKKLDKVHEAAFEIRDLVNALADTSTDLPADNLARVKSNARYVADIAKRLDESGDAGDQAATEANFKKMQDFLKTIEAQYPDNLILPYSESGELEHQAYVCPMHPEVRQPQPGKCPKCGMTLQPVEK
jgi:rubrerythrin